MLSRSSASPGWKGSLASESKNLSIGSRSPRRTECKKPPPRCQQTLDTLRQALFCKAILQLLQGNPLRAIRIGNLATQLLPEILRPFFQEVLQVSRKLDLLLLRKLCYLLLQFTQAHAAENNIGVPFWDVEASLSAAIFYVETQALNPRLSWRT